MSQSVLSIRSLKATSKQGKQILSGVDLEIKPGTLHAIMGPNGSGKSTLASLLAGVNGQDFKIQGEVSFKGESLLDMEPEERARKGFFLGYQYPVALPGVPNAYMLRLAVNKVREARGLEPMDAYDFLASAKEKIRALGLGDEFLNRSTNDGFSGGEKKRNEIWQMQMLEPAIAVLDETDSGLDVDALKTVAQGIEQMRNSERSFIVITHYQRLLDYVSPDFVHVFTKGRIARTGDAKLALELDRQGYASHLD